MASEPALPVDLALEAMLPKTYLGVPTRRSSGPAYLLTYGFDGCLFVCDYDLAAYAKALGVDQDAMTGAWALPGGSDLVLTFAMRSPGVRTDRLIPAWVAVRQPGHPEAAYPITIAGKHVTEAYFGPCMVLGTNFLYAVDDVLLSVVDATGGADYVGCEAPSAAITDAISQLP
jgi:hypothetical protein